MEGVVTIDFLKENYRDKKVFVTGHTGFKGSWLFALLYTLGAKVKGYALAPEHDGLFTLLDKKGFIDESIIADIRDKDKLNEAITDFQPDYIFHLAAQPLVRRSYSIPAETFDVNVVGTANLLEIAKDLNNPCAVVVVTTDKVYENKEQHILYKEEDALGGYDPYSASKACAELVVSSFRNSFFNPGHNNQQKSLASARAGNVIGGGDWSDNRIIPDIVRALEKATTIEVRNPTSVRPWQHVLEPLCGYLLLGILLKKDPLNYSKAFNFGPLPKDHLTVKELVTIAIEAWGSGEWRNTSSPTDFHEAGLLQLDISKAMKELNWKPKLDAATAIGWTINWYAKPDEEKIDFTFEQINKYLAL